MKVPGLPKQDFLKSGKMWNNLNQVVAMASKFLSILRPAWTKILGIFWKFV